MDKRTMTRWIKRTGKLGLGALILLGSLAAMLVLSGLRDDLGEVDALLVLGNKVELDGTPSERLKARLDRAVEVFQSGLCQIVIVSGGTGKEGFDEARVMRDYLKAAGVPEAVIVMDPLGFDTYESARNGASILQSRQMNSVMVITQYFHVPRSRLALQRFGVTEIRQAPARYFELRDFYSVAREIPAYLKYLVRNYPAEPQP